MTCSTRIAVRGVGLTTSLGAGVDENWRRICAGESGFAPIRCFDVSEASVQDGGVAPSPPGVDAEALFGDGRVRARLLYDTTIREALRSSGWEGDEVRDPRRTALVLGSSLAASAANSVFWDGFLGPAGPAGADYSTLQSYDVEPLLADLAATFGIEGETILVANACAAGASAVAIAREILDSHEADQVLVAGGDPIELHTFAGFHALGLLTPEPLQPFRAGRRGMKLGDGFAALVLEREDSLRTDHRGSEAVRAWLVGTGESADAHSLTQPHPRGKGAALAMRRALAMAGRAAADVDYVNLHATATLGNDSSEYHALADVFGDRLGEVLMHAAKPSVGHTLGAAGAVEAVLTVCVLEHQFVPATLGDHEIDPEFEGFRFPAAAGPADVRYGMTNSFGFGGSNASLLFARAESER